jgi:hypothetical protein
MAASLPELSRVCCPSAEVGPPGRPGAHSPHLVFRKAFTAPGDIFTRLSPSLLPVFSTLAGVVHRAILPCSARSVTPPGLFALEPEFSASHFLPHFFVPVAGEYSKIPSPCLRTEPFHAWSTRFKVEFRLAYFLNSPRPGLVRLPYRLPMVGVSHTPLF